MIWITNCNFFSEYKVHIHLYLISTHIKDNQLFCPLKVSLESLSELAMKKDTENKADIGKEIQI